MSLCAFVEWPEGLDVAGREWGVIRRSVDAARPDLLVTNELPFGPWLAGADALDVSAARRSVELHEHGLGALAALGVPAVISSRPVWTGEKLANEAFVLERGRAVALHAKHMLPEEPGWREATWYEAGTGGFAARTVAGLRVGVLLCTELMFNERARRYGRDGADLIVVPRATGTDHSMWRTAAAMAAIVAGSYVVSSNRAGRGSTGPEFGGGGFAFAPDGSLLASTSPENPLTTVRIDVERSRRQKAEYPCYVKDA